MLQKASPSASYGTVPPIASRGGTRKEPGSKKKRHGSSAGSASLGSGSDAGSDNFKESEQQAMGLTASKASAWSGTNCPVKERDHKAKAMESSVASLDLPLQILVYSLAVALLIFVLVAPTFSHQSDHSDGHAHVMRTIAYSVLSAGSCAYLFHMLGQPILLGYIFGGAFIGPFGLAVISCQDEIHMISELGLIFLLFMIGLELDLNALCNMGKEVVFAGALQFPACTCAHYAIFQALATIGLTVGTGHHCLLYMSACCALSSTMIVGKKLQAKQELDSRAGQVTLGILLFQDLWAIVFLALQPNLSHVSIEGVLRTSGMMALLVGIAFVYSKWILPPVLKSASATTELMLVLAMTWCFFVCSVALLHWVDLSMELGALIAGMSMASFPYSLELISKIKYIRDFFITLYFVALGMQIPVPTVHVIGMALVACAVILVIRWLGVFCTLYCISAGERPSILATINLSNMSEVSLVIAALGASMHHIEVDTMIILIWTFSILALMSSFLIGHNTHIYNFLAQMSGMNGSTTPRRTSRARRGSDDQQWTEEDLAAVEEDSDSAVDMDPTQRNIIMLGCFTVGWELILELEKKRPELLRRMAVIDFNSQNRAKFESKGIAFTYGDISMPDVIAYHESATLIVSTVPDAILSGTCNAELVETAKEVFPNSQIMAIASNVDDAEVIYEAGADYVLMITKLGAERIADILVRVPVETLNLDSSLKELKGSDNPHIRRLSMQKATIRAHAKALTGGP